MDDIKTENFTIETPHGPVYVHMDSGSALDLSNRARHYAGQDILPNTQMTEFGREITHVFVYSLRKLGDLWCPDFSGGWQSKRWYVDQKSRWIKGLLEAVNAYLQEHPEVVNRAEAKLLDGKLGSLFEQRSLELKNLDKLQQEIADTEARLAAVASLPGGELPRQEAYPKTPTRS